MPPHSPVRKRRSVRTFPREKNYSQASNGDLVSVKALHPNSIVGIGGSAGALNSYKALLDALPSNTGMAFVMVSNIHCTAESRLVQILSGRTKMPAPVSRP